MELDYLTVVTLITYSTTIFFVLSPVPMAVTAWKTRFSDNMPFITFLSSACAAALCALYGLLVVKRAELIALQSFSIVFGSFYMFTYLRLTRHKTGGFAQLLFGVGTTAGLVFYILQQPLAEQASLLGQATTAMTTVMVVSPITQLFDALIKRSSRDIDMTMLVATVLNNALWLYYGLLLHDAYIAFPSYPGLAVQALIILAKIALPKEKAPDKRE